MIQNIVKCTMLTHCENCALKTESKDLYTLYSSTPGVQAITLCNDCIQDTLDAAGILPEEF